jgi:hypothetical protein
MKMPCPNCIHIAKSLEKPIARPKLVKEYAFANAEKDANKIERNGRNEESPAPNKGYAQ